MLNSKTGGIWMVILLLSPIRKLVRNAANKLLYLRKYFMKFSVHRAFKNKCSYGKEIVWKNSLVMDFQSLTCDLLAVWEIQFFPLSWIQLWKKSNKLKRWKNANMQIHLIFFFMFNMLNWSMRLSQVILISQYV